MPVVKLQIPRTDTSTIEGMKAATSFLIDLGSGHAIRGHKPYTMSELGAVLLTNGFYGWRKGQERAFLAVYKMAGWAAVVAQDGQLPKGW